MRYVIMGSMIGVVIGIRAGGGGWERRRGGVGGLTCDSCGYFHVRRIHGNV
jgi:hypothetical protein